MESMTEFQATVRTFPTTDMINKIIGCTAEEMLSMADGSTTSLYRLVGISLPRSSRTSLPSGRANGELNTARPATQAAVNGETVTRRAEEEERRRQHDRLALELALSDDDENDIAPPPAVKNEPLVPKKEPVQDDSAPPILTPNAGHKRLARDISRSVVDQKDKTPLKAAPAVAENSRPSDAAGTEDQNCGISYWLNKSRKPIVEDPKPSVEEMRLMLRESTKMVRTPSGMVSELSDSEAEDEPRSTKRKAKTSTQWRTHATGQDAFAGHRQRPVVSYNDLDNRSQMTKVEPSKSPTVLRTDPVCESYLVREVNSLKFKFLRPRAPSPSDTEPMTNAEWAEQLHDLNEGVKAKKRKASEFDKTKEKASVKQMRVQDKPKTKKAKTKTSGDSVVTPKSVTMTPSSVASSKSATSSVQKISKVKTKTPTATQVPKTREVNEMEFLGMIGGRAESRKNRMPAKKQPSAKSLREPPLQVKSTMGTSSSRVVMTSVDASSSKVAQTSVGMPSSGVAKSPVVALSSNVSKSSGAMSSDVSKSSVALSSLDVAKTASSSDLAKTSVKPSIAKTMSAPASNPFVGALVAPTMPAKPSLPAWLKRKSSEGGPSTPGVPEPRAKRGRDSANQTDPWTTASIFSERIPDCETGSSGSGSRRPSAVAYRLQSEKRNSSVEEVVELMNRLTDTERRENLRYSRSGDAENNLRLARDLKCQTTSLRKEKPLEYAPTTMRAIYQFFVACHVYEVKNLKDKAFNQYNELVNYIRGMATAFEQIYNAEWKKLIPHKPERARQVERWKSFLIIVCTQLKAIACYRMYTVKATEVSQLRHQLIEDTRRLGVDLSFGAGYNPNRNGVAKPSQIAIPIPYPAGPSPAPSDVMTPSPNSSGGASGVMPSGAVQLPGETVTKLQQYIEKMQRLMVCHEYWQHAQEMESKSAWTQDMVKKVVGGCSIHLESFVTSIVHVLRYIEEVITIYNRSMLETEEPSV